MNANSPRQLRNDRGYELRPAVASDECAIHELARTLGYADPPGEGGESFRQILASEGQAIFVAARDDRIVGWVHVFAAQRPGLPGFAEIGGIVTDEEHRRRGVATLLLGQSEDWARTRNQRMIRVRCNVDRAVAHAFYDAAGYRSTKRQIVFDKMLEDVQDEER